MHKVLVVDDEKKILVLAKKFLGKEGYQVITSADPIEALDIIENQGPIAVILTDERMPNMRGTEFLKKVKTHSPCTSRILTTGQFDRELLEKAVNDGEIFRFLKKPLDMKAVKDTITEGIEQYEEQLKPKKLAQKIKKLAQEKEKIAADTEGLADEISLLRKSKKLLIGILALVVLGVAGFSFMVKQAQIGELESNSKKVGSWIVYSNATARDTRTDLLWMIYDFRNLNLRQPHSWDEAMEWAEEMNAKKQAGYSDWRVPTIEEYAGTYDPERTRLAYDKKEKYKVGVPKVFANGGGYAFWSSQPKGLHKARYFFFIGGYERTAEKTYDNPSISVRLVRDAG